MMQQTERLSVCVQNPPDKSIRLEFAAALADRSAVQWGCSTERPCHCQVLVAGRSTAELLHSHPEVSHVVIPFAGIPQETRLTMQGFQHISVHNLHHNAAATAEMALTLLLAAAKYLVPFDQKLRMDDWSPRYLPPPTIGLSGKCALVLGYGAIGQRVARLCLALEMQARATRESIKNAYQDASGIDVFPASELQNLLSEADVLIITLPLTPATTGLIATPELDRMPPQGILVNVGRGAIVDEQALFQALRQGSIGAAGLDVWWQYPDSVEARQDTAPSMFPFHQLENVVMSPHRGGATRDSDKLRYGELAKLLNAFLRTGEMPNRVNL